MTIHGEYLHRMWSAPYKMISDATAAVEHIMDEYPSRVTIGVLAGEYLDPKIISAFQAVQKRHDNLSIFFEQASYSKIRHSFNDGHYNAIITKTFEADSMRNIHYIVLPCRKGMNLVMSTQSPWASKHGYYMVDLKDETFIVISQKESPNCYQHTINVLRQTHLILEETNIRQEECVDDLLMDVEMGMGIALLSANTVLDGHPNIHVERPPQSNFFDGGSLVFAAHKNDFNPYIWELIQEFKRFTKDINR